MSTKHLDEARKDAIAAVEQLLLEEKAIERVVLIDDLFGRIRIVIWSPQDCSEAHRRLASERLAEAAGPYWSHEVWLATDASKADEFVYQRAWEEGHHVTDRLRLADRVRNRTAWFSPIGEPPWSAVGKDSGPPIVVFYSFKGGVGRTTALASFAIQHARAGERVAVLDLDLDAPGAGTLLAADEKGTIARWGVVDYLLERALGDVELRDYYHACRRTGVTGDGEILVVPAGSLETEREYTGKLARLDLELPPAGAGPHPLRSLLEQVRAELAPRWICIDARAGLSESAGVLLSGMAHLQVLFGTSSEQSWLGLRLVLERIGASRVRANQPQLDCVLVHAMVPQEAEAAKKATEEFAERASCEFRDQYYAPDPQDANQDDDRLWYLRDAEASDAPSSPAAIPYQSKLAHFAAVDGVADHLAGAAEFVALAERISARFREEED